MYTHPERSDPEAGMQEIIDRTGGLKLSEVHMEAQEMQGLNEIMNEDDLDSEEEEFRFELTGKGASTIWQYGLWSFQTGGTTLERFLPKNEHTQRKCLNFENWTSSLQKSKFLKLIILIFHVK